MTTKQAEECRRTLQLDSSPFYEPRIIDGPGEYKLRNGRRVTIHELKLPPGYTPGNMCFPAKGSVWLKKTWTPNPPFCIWRLDGRCRATGDHPWDVVGRWLEEEVAKNVISKITTKEIQ